MLWKLRRTSQKGGNRKIMRRARRKRDARKCALSQEGCTIDVRWRRRGQRGRSEPGAHNLSRIKENSRGMGDKTEVQLSRKAAKLNTNCIRQSGNVKTALNGRKQRRNACEMHAKRQGKSAAIHVKERGEIAAKGWKTCARHL